MSNEEGPSIPVDVKAQDWNLEARIINSSKSNEIQAFLGKKKATTTRTLKPSRNLKIQSIISRVKEVNKINTDGRTDR